MGFWSSIGDAISSAASATYNAVKTAVVATKNFVVSAAEAVGSAVAGAFDWVYNKMKQLVNTLTEWKDNALKLLSLTYPTWLAISIFGAGALLLLYAAILGPALIIALLMLLMNRLFTNADNGASNDNQADLVAETLKEQAEVAFNKGEYEAAKELYQKAFATAKGEANKRHYETRLDEVEKILKNLEADKLNKEGWEAYNENDFESARDKFAEAYSKCSTDSVNRQKFYNDLNQTKAKIFCNEGQQKFNSGEYEEAIEKFKDAIRHRNESDYHDKVAECFFELGKQAHIAKDSKKAQEFYQKAIDECSHGYEGEEKFKKSLREIFNDIKNEEAEKFNAEGLSKMQNGNFEAAKQKFSKAFGHCASNYKSKKNFEENMKHAQAAIFNQDANEFFESGKFHEAVEKYREAIAALPPSKVSDLNKYKNQLSNTFNAIALQHMEKEEFEEAKKFLTMAIEESGENNENTEIFKENLERVENGMKNQSAEKLFSEGLAAFDRSDFQAAFDKFSQAFEHCTPDYKNRKTFELNLNRSHAAIFNSEGEKLYENKNFEEAVEKFMKALEKLPESFEDDLITLKTNLSKSHNEIGLEAWSRRNFVEAKENFESAVSFCVIEEDLKALNEQLSHANAAVLNLEAERLCEEEKFEEAIEKFKKALLTIVRSDSEIFKPAENEKLYRKNLAGAYNKFGHQLLQDLKFDDAKMVFILAIDEALESDKENVEKYRKDMKKAELAILHRDIEKIYEKGLSELESKNYEKAFQLFTQAEEKCHKNYHNKQKIVDNKNFSEALIYFRDGSEALKHKDMENAVKKMSRALELLPQHKMEEKELFTTNLAEAYNSYGELLISQNCFQMALNNFRKAFDLNVNETFANNIKKAEAEILFEAGMNCVYYKKIEQAAEKFQQAVLVGGDAKKSFAKNPTEELLKFAKKLIDEGNLTNAVEIFELSLKFAPEEKFEAITFERNSIKLQILTKEFENFRERQELKKALEKLDEALEFSTSEEISNEIKAKKSKVLEELSVKLLSEKKFDKVIENIQENKNLKVSDENFDQQIAATNLLKVLNQIPKLSPEVAVRRLTKALDDLKNFDFVNSADIETILKIFLESDAIEEAKEFIAKSSEKVQAKLWEVYNKTRVEKVGKQLQMNMQNFGAKRTKREAQLIGH